MGELEITYSIPPQVENELIRMGILPTTEFEELEGPYSRAYYQEVFSKDYYRSPYDGNGEIRF